MKPILKILLVVIYLCSCTSIHLIKHNQSDYDELNDDLDSEDVTIIKTNQDMIKGCDLRVSLDSTRWQDTNQNQTFTSTAEIKEIIYQSSWNGAEDGFYCGFLIGAGIGLIGVLSKSGNDDDSYASPILATALVGIGWGLGSGLVGLPIGAVIGHTDRYIFHTSSDSFPQNLKANNV